MFKKVVLSLLITLFVLAFPLRIFNLSAGVEAGLKIFKCLLFIGLAFLLMQQEGFLHRRILCAKLCKKVLASLLPVLLIIGIYIGYFFKTGLTEFDGSVSLLALTLIATLLAASAEEVIFRGYIFNLFKKHHHTFFKSLLLSSILFSLIHIINIFRFEDGWAIFNQVIFAFALGMLLGSIYALTNNLLLVCFLHFLINIPSSVKRITHTMDPKSTLTPPSLSEELMSTTFFIMLMLPVLMLAFNYIRIIHKRDASVEKTHIK